MSDYALIEDTKSAYYSANDALDSHEYYSHVVGSTGRSYDRRDIGAGDTNKWMYQSFFTEPPQIAYEDNSYADYYARITESTYDVTFPELDDNQDKVYFSEYEPDDGENDGDIEFTLGYGWGPVSAGTAINIFPSVSLSENDSAYATWEMDHGLAGRAPPDDQKNGIGVSFNMNAYSNLEGNTYEVRLEDQQAYEIRQLYKPDSIVTTIYSTEAHNTMYHDIDIV